MDNCVVSVHLGYAAGDFHTLLDGDLFLPEHTWNKDRSRCRAAGIPDDVVYRPKWQIALEQIRGALGNGVRFERLFEDSKTELGMDHFEVRKYISIQRHLVLTCVSHLFLTEFWLAHRDKKTELTLCQVRTATRSPVPV